MSNASVDGLLIGDVARRVGVSTATIRYYESLGLLPTTARSEAGYRRYSASAVAEIEFIKKAQAIGFSLDEVLEILNLSRQGETPCAHVLDLAQRQLMAVDARIEQLRAFREALATDLTAWQASQRTVTCDGLCAFIANIERDQQADAVTMRLHPHRTPRLKS